MTSTRPRYRQACAFVAAVLTAIAWQAARAQQFGSWTDGGGNTRAVTCPALRAYGEVTLLPERCPAARQGALYTLELDAWVDAELAELRQHRDRLPRWREAVRVRDSRIGNLEAALDRAADDLADASAELHTAKQRAGAAEREAQRQARAFKWGDAAIGAAVGAVVSAGALFAVWAL